MVERSSSALCVPGSCVSSILTRNKYLHDLHLVVPGLIVCVSDFSVCKCTQDTGVIPSIGQDTSIFFLKREI